mmetsp:Transcript_11131/g.15444  ORF Transcript_11131/g.15444 Transcript_11131/m.15444 type:complete len:194 (+) Transcript_11131:256-837(+)|eukprot:CAMPEP_0185268766 /NCGR_PEP_ID=MMETSP1359-20130426/37908_1 /TAXON_ID=552665 /ORGANISM="Bigelowiella longifila, Strain CCMP242" /LENGTH=193 /DNA_ID=CAMNT_0027859645 /DNA_START=226 /DNA_END=810 /DNA_ORIENTATION=-
MSLKPASQDLAFMIQDALGRNVAHQGLVTLILDYVAGGVCDKCSRVDEYEEFISVDCIACHTRCESSLCFDCTNEELQERGQDEIPPTRLFVNSSIMSWDFCPDCLGSLCEGCAGGMMKCGCMQEHVCPFCFSPGSCENPTCSVGTGSSPPNSKVSSYWTTDSLHKYKWDGEVKSLPLKRLNNEAIRIARYWT